MRYFPFLKTALWLSMISLLVSCNDQGELGESIIEPVRFGTFKDDLPFKMKTISRDSVISTFCSDFFVGRTEDPVFGEFEAGFYAQMSIIPFDTIFSDFMVDSVYLQLLYDTLWYGDTMAPFDIYVHRLLENPDFQTNLGSDTEFEVSTEPIGSLESFTPQLTETITEDTVAQQVRGRLRIPLDNSVGEELLSYDSASYASNITFQDQFNGVFVRAGDNTRSMVAFDMAISEISGYYTALIVYFTTNGVQDSLQLLISRSGDFRLGYYKKDQSGALIEDYIDDYERGEELGFLSGHAGNAVDIDLEEAAEFLSDFIVNHAEICLPLNESLGYDYDVYRPAEVITPIFEDDMGNLFDIVDYTNRRFFVDYRLDMDTSNMYRQYCLDISLHMQNIILGNLPNQIRILASNVERNGCDIQEPYKAVINGRNNSEVPARLIVYYTEPE